MPYLKIIKTPVKLKGPVSLPASKSISNRVLMIRALSGAPFMIQNLSVADDTVLMQSLFKQDEKEIYIKNAGTVARFLLAYYASRPCDVVLKGSDRMAERPIGSLANALQQLGADIQYLENDGHLPIHIQGKVLQGGPVTIDAGISSQFVSALLMIAPTLTEGLSIAMQGETVSWPYIEMTLKIMARFGIHYHAEANKIAIPHQKYHPIPFFVEADWSSASYIFALAALFPGSEIAIEDLEENSLQGDHIIKDLIKAFGVLASFDDNRCTLQSGAPTAGHFHFDFTGNPDLAPTFVCLCCAMGMPFEISGTKTLNAKESRRADVLQTELAKLGYSIKTTSNAMAWDGIINDIQGVDIYLNTYNDHRMAMCFAMLAAKNSHICIMNPDVTDKSFPAFWEELRKLGFEFDTDQNE